MLTLTSNAVMLAAFVGGWEVVFILAVMLSPRPVPRSSTCLN
jgi:hypothetical protein